ncbi:MMPL family transporter [Psychrobacillus lasiicapitis]|uniref:MMPL family transporter n=1 Tax=Psychrobacillus lasiicapitis TaxID=1636719 RepID=A0A544TCC8_9BACI|nr:MMPL family transporter [Psychrobacillus lasiicapitis]TQR15105.1 MMPL family transporter [Psychrobacillus lasiicapitis]GGA22491.1 membrane protein [Psychrobacillus lasiicapitis]
MKKALRHVTDFVAKKSGMWTTLGIWLAITVLLTVFAPSASEYKVSSVDSLPEDAKSVIAQKNIDEHFKDAESIPGILVLQSEEGEINVEALGLALDKVSSANINGLKEMISFSSLPPQALAGFFSEDKNTVVIPFSFDPSLETDELEASLEATKKIVTDETGSTVYMTGPAGIAVDTTNLFSRADVVLLLSTVGIILILLMVIYRSPLLALIPLLAAAIVYQVVNQLLGILGANGLELASQSVSIMSILLFAATIDYSLFVFSRYREELKNYEQKFDAMKWAMRETGIPVFFAGGTVFVAMLVLFFANFGDYKNFAPIFGTTMFVIMFASVTLIPALFTLFGRKSFWPRIPKYEEQEVKASSLWNKIGSFVVNKPLIAAFSILIILVVSALNMFNMKYEFDTIKSFPDDMPSREGYEIIEEKFEKGDLAPTTVLFESASEITEDVEASVMEQLSKQELVSSVRPTGVSEDGLAVQYQLTFGESPYSEKSMDALEEMVRNAENIVKASNAEGELFFAGETAIKVDDRSVNDRDLIVIVLLETLLIFTLLIVLTRSLKMPIYMMGTILLSFLAALGLGMFLSNLFFDIDTISNRVPLYSFVFLVALGIDYNIILISRFLEERKKHHVKEAVQIAVTNTGGVISSAGILLAATFAVLMTQPIQLLFVFGFIVAVGIILDTFLIRGILLPALIVLFEKDKN